MLRYFRLWTISVIFSNTPLKLEATFLVQNQTSQCVFVDSNLTPLKATKKKCFAYLEDHPGFLSLISGYFGGGVSLPKPYHMNSSILGTWNVWWWLLVDWCFEKLHGLRWRPHQKIFWQPIYCPESGDKPTQWSVVKQWYETGVWEKSWSFIDEGYFHTDLN